MAGAGLLASRLILFPSGYFEAKQSIYVSCGNDPI